MELKDRIIIALDFSDEASALDIVSRTSEFAGVYKVGFELFVSAGPGIVTKLNSLGVKVFLDLKFHDIPNTVGQASGAAAALGVLMFNVHASGGLDMMKKAAESAARAGKDRPLALGVTVLTSMNDRVLKEEIGIPLGANAQVLKLAKLAKQAGLDGVVCSGEEIKAVKETCGKDFKLVVPGARPAWAAGDDQKRIITPREAIAAGADYIVIGRPITKAKDPKEAAKRVLEELQQP